MSELPSYSIYYQAYVERELCWFVTSTLRSYDHLVFDRTLDPSTSLFEFFVSPAAQSYFVAIMAQLEKEGVVHTVRELPNRLKEQEV